jgi:predicted P-loop ATPase
MESLSYANEYNPLVDWLAGLKWDGRDWLSEFFTSFRLTGEFDQTLVRKTLVAMVARALRPGCKVDTMLILVGPQGIRKSGLIEALCPIRDYFLDSCAMSGNKDELEKLRSAWAVEIPELASMRLKDNEHLKSYLSQTQDTYRAAYARASGTHPRHCVFFGTTNDDEFLRDATGNRRFWVVRLAFERGETMPYEWVAEHRDDLFAQVVALYNDEEPWWLNSADELRLDERNREFAEQDAWEARVLQWAHRHHHFTTDAVLEQVISLDPMRWDKKAKARVSDILRAHGFKYQPFKGVKCWYNPAPEPESDGEAAQKETVGDEAERWANKEARKKPRVKA